MGEGIRENSKKSGMLKYALLRDRSIAALLRGHIPAPPAKNPGFKMPSGVLAKKGNKQKSEKETG
jgi:hypothetical protein